MNCHSGSIFRDLRMAAYGASRPLRRIPAIVSFLNPQPALSLVGGNRRPGRCVAATGWSAADPAGKQAADPGGLLTGAVVG